MLRKRYACVLFLYLTLILPATSQEIVDETATYSSTEVQQELFSALAGKIADPYTAKLHFVIPRKEYVCGFVNSKNAFGAYTGAIPFLYDLTTKELRILPDASDPLFGLVELRLKQRGCAISL